MKRRLAAGGDPHGKTYSGRRVIDFAQELGNAAVVEVLGAKSKAPLMDLGTAIATDSVARVVELVAKQGLTAVLRECGNDGHAEVLRAALATKAKRKPAELASALWYSVCNGHDANVAPLLEHGADPNIALLKKAGAKVR